MLHPGVDCPARGRCHRCGDMGNPFALDEQLCRRRGLRVRLRFGLDGSVTVDGRGRIIIAVTGAVRRRVNAAVAALLVATAVLLVLGVALERHAESGAAPHSVSETVGEDEGHHEESGETTHEADVHGDEDNAGESATVDAIESPWVVALGTLAAAALAVAVWRRPTRPVIALVVAFTDCPRWSSTYAKSATTSARVAPVSSFSLG